MSFGRKIHIIHHSIKDEKIYGTVKEGIYGASALITLDEKNQKIMFQTSLGKQLSVNKFDARKPAPKGIFLHKNLYIKETFEGFSNTKVLKS